MLYNLLRYLLGNAIQKAIKQAVKRNIKPYKQSYSVILLRYKLTHQKTIQGLYKAYKRILHRHKPH